MAAAMYMFWKHTISCLLALMCVAVLVRESNARPPWLAADSEVFTTSAACDTDVELLDLCQRCAKMTKSRHAYPMCCSTDLEARKWCSDFVYFGQSGY